jgi:hypothetical protein
MKYKKEVEELLKELFLESWMDENDWVVFLEETQRVGGISIDDISKDIEIGVKNGYSPERQIEILKQILRENN